MYSNDSYFLYTYDAYIVQILKSKKHNENHKVLWFSDNEHDCFCINSVPFVAGFSLQIRF